MPDIERGQAEAAEKVLVQEYIKQYRLDTCLNDAINVLVKDRPENPFAILADLLKKQSITAKGIQHIKADKIIDSNGAPTLAVQVTTDKGVFNTAVSGDVQGIAYEAKAPTLKQAEGDEDDAPEEEEKEKRLPLCEAVEQCALDFHTNVQHALENMNPTEQTKIDEILNGLESKLGRNGTLALSMAVCKAGARERDMELYEYIATLAETPTESLAIPVPHISLINGGTYASNKLFARELMVLPLNATSFNEAINAGLEIQKTLQQLLEQKEEHGHANIGVYGGFTPLNVIPNEIFELLAEAIKITKEALQNMPEIGIAVNVAANDFQMEVDDQDNSSGLTLYDLDLWSKSAKAAPKNSDELMETLQNLAQDFNIMTFIDPFGSMDLPTYAKWNSAANTPQVDETNPDEPPAGLGGDMFCNIQFAPDVGLTEGVHVLVQEHACNTVLIDLSKYATITEALAAVKQARDNNLIIIAGCPQGETTDTFAADFAIGIGASQAKFGGLRSEEANAKYNRYLQLSASEFAPRYIGADYRLTNTSEEQ